MQKTYRRILQTVLILVQFLRCTTFDDNSCPENSSSYPNCYCNLNYTKINISDGNSFKCEKCIECPIEKCQGRYLRCDRKEPYAENSTQRCVKPSKGKFVNHGDIEICRPKCGLNEYEFKKCGCDQNRQCQCLKHLYRGGGHLACSKQCSKCLSPEHRRVPEDLGCYGMPSDERCVEMEKPTAASNIHEPITTTPYMETKISHHPKTEYTTFPNEIMTSNDPAVADYDSEIVDIFIDNISENPFSIDNIKKFSVYIVLIIIIAIIIIVIILFACWYFKRRKRNKTYLQGDERIPLGIIQPDENSAVINISDHNSNVPGNEEIPNKILESLVGDWSAQYRIVFEKPCKKAEKDAYLELAFKGVEDLEDIKMYTDNANGCNYVTVMDHVKTRYPKYNLKNLVTHMRESGNRDLVNILIKKISKETLKDKLKDIQTGNVDCEVQEQLV